MMGIRRFLALCRNTRGVAALELALVAPVFILFVSMASELAALLFAMRTIDNAVERAAREIRVGYTPTRGLGSDGFKDLVCSRVPGYAECTDYLKVKVVSAPEISDLPNKESIARENQFDVGGPEEYVGVIATYTWAPITVHFVSGSDEPIVFQSRTAFRNEPFPVSR